MIRKSSHIKHCIYVPHYVGAWATINVFISSILAFILDSETQFTSKIHILLPNDPDQVLAMEAGAGGPLLLQRELPLLLFQPWNARGRHTVAAAAARLYCQQGHVAAFSHGNTHTHTILIIFLVQKCIISDYILNVHTHRISKCNYFTSFCADL